MTVALLSALYAILSLLAIFIVIAAKWAILGRRRPGSYNWDESSYCQRWQVLLACQTLLRNGSGSPGGVLGMLTGTHYLVLYFRALGARLGKDCALFAGGRPGLSTLIPYFVSLPWIMTFRSTLETYWRDMPLVTSLCGAILTSL